MNRTYEIYSIPSVINTAQIVQKEDKVYLKNGLKLFELSISPKLLSIILSAVDSKKTVDQIHTKLGADFNINDLLNFFSLLDGKLFTIKERENRNSIKISAKKKSQIIIIGNGELAINLYYKLSLKSWANPRWLIPSGCKQYAKSMINPEVVSDQKINETVENSEMSIIALEGVKYEVYYKYNETILNKSTPCLFLVPGDHEIIVGPMLIPGKTACFECLCKALYYPENESMKEVIKKFRTSVWTASLVNKENFLNQLNENLVLEVSNILGYNYDCNFRYTHFLERVVNDEKKYIEKRPIFQQESCSCMGKQYRKDKNQASQRIDLYLAAIFDDNSTDVSEFQNYNGIPFIKKIGIVGGGTAGYLTAIALRKSFPFINVELIESSKISPIGVGEGTTPYIRHFLHDRLQLDISDFFDKVKPTWKLGVKFFWGKPGSYYFNYPFGIIDSIPALVFEKNINKCSLNSMLMDRDALPVIINNSDYISLLDRIRYAYHMDNKLLAQYLKDKSIEAGVRIIETDIVQVIPNSDKSKIHYLVTEEGKHLKYDLFIDCTGFRSLLIGEALGSSFKNYKSSLYTNNALIARGPMDKMRPYTISETMDNGWCWSIPTQEGYHYGYVFSSDFCSLDTAWEEMNKKKDLKGNPKIVKFISGRHEHFWKGNVVAIGNSYGFVEPLEATGIHMIIESIETLIRSLPQCNKNSAFNSFLNKKIGDHWDYLRWFLSLHYKFNKKSGSKFWKFCNEECDVSGIQDLIDLFLKTGPLTYQSKFRSEIIDQRIPDNIFGRNGFDHILLGQGVVPECSLSPKYDPKIWNLKKESYTSLSGSGILQKQALKIISNHSYKFLTVNPFS